MADCIFCRIAAKEIPATAVYEDDSVIAFKDLEPQAPVHVLIIPKKHIKSLLGLTQEDRALVAHIHVDVVPQLAKELGLVYLDTGAMYRLFTLKMLKEKTSFSDSSKINELLEKLNINIENDRFYLDEKDVSEDIRKPDVAENV